MEPRRGTQDRGALREVEARLNQGRVVVIYPEGTRAPDGHVRRAKPGVGMLVARTGVPVVPAYVTGTADAWPRGAKWLRCRPVSVTFGEPIQFASTKGADEFSGGRKQVYDAMSQEIMDQIAALRHGRDEAGTKLRDSGN